MKRLQLQGCSIDTCCCWCLLLLLWVAGVSVPHEAIRQRLQAWLPQQGDLSQQRTPMLEQRLQLPYGLHMILWLHDHNHAVQ